MAQHHRLLAARRIGFYWPTGSEFDVLPLLNHALRLGRACYLPVLPARRQRKLWFSRLTGRGAWRLNRFGIDEFHAPRMVRAQRLDLLILPLVGFDERGFRLGMGGGFYDATLAHLAGRRHYRKPRLVGAGYECQRVTRLPREPWDRPLDAALTERTVHRFRPALPGPQTPAVRTA